MEVFANGESTRRFFASQALVGLLANGRLNRSLTVDNKVSPEGAKRLSELSFEIANAMVETAMETQKRA